MRPNRVRQILQSGGTSYGVTLGSASPLMAELAGHIGYDWVMIDLQHGENNLNNVAPMLTAISATEAIPWVRVHENNPALNVPHSPTSAVMGTLIGSGPGSSKRAIAPTNRPMKNRMMR